MEHYVHRLLSSVSAVSREVAMNETIHLHAETLVFLKEPLEVQLQIKIHNICIDVSYDDGDDPLDSSLEDNEENIQSSVTDNIDSKISEGTCKYFILNELLNF